MEREKEKGKRAFLKERTGGKGGEKQRGRLKKEAAAGTERLQSGNSQQIHSFLPFTAFLISGGVKRENPCRQKAAGVRKIN